MSSLRDMFVVCGITLAMTPVLLADDQPSKAKAAEWHPPISAPIHYTDTTVVLADSNGVAAISFHCCSDDKHESPATSEVIEYRYRYLTSEGVETSGHGLLFKNYKNHGGNSTVVVDEGGQIQVRAGHFRLEWSQSSAPKTGITTSLRNCGCNLRSSKISTSCRCADSRDQAS